jgi:hypothetical protein
MLIILPLVAIGAGFIYLAGTLEAQGVYWAYRVCRTSWGLCRYSDWLLLVSGIIFVSYFVLNRNAA